MKQDLLVIVAKSPASEKVKTRLARSIGEAQARNIYSEILHRLITEHSNRSYQLILYVQGDLKYFSGFKHISIKKQVNGNLGDKLWDIFQTELPYYRKVILIGSDLPLNCAFVEDAFTKFEQDFIIGPAYDGGYYLIGLKRPHDVFSGIPWSTEVVYEKTISRIEHFSSHYTVLETKRDIDTYDDLQYYRTNGLLSFDLLH